MRRVVKIIKPFTVKIIFTINIIEYYLNNTNEKVFNYAKIYRVEIEDYTVYSCLYWVMCFQETLGVIKNSCISQGHWFFTLLEISFTRGARE